MKKRKKISLSSLADMYYEGELTIQHKRRLFRKELERKFGHHLPLEKRLKRSGYHRRRPLTPEMVKVITDRIGEP